jgi:anti-anti-sigma factor
MDCRATDSPLFCIEITTLPLSVALRCAGEIDISNVEVLERALRASLSTGAATVEVDLRSVEYLDSGTLNALLDAYRALAHDGRRMRVRVQPRAATLFEVTGLTRLLDVRPG